MQTAYAMANEREKSFEIGCIDYITKPLNKVQIVNALSKALNYKK
jgi:CheY-like chemotaxis protein